MTEVLSTDAVLVEQRGPVTLITLNRPESRNAVNLDVHLGVGRAIAAADKNPEVRAIILTGKGDVFCAGLDLKALARGDRLKPNDPIEFGWGFAGVIEHAIGTPLIAAVNGSALGGGTELALACDLVVASDTARFGLPEVKRGVIAGAGGAIRLIQQLPHKIAMEMLLTGDPIDAHKALEYGLINKVVPADRLLDEAFVLAERIAINAPLSVQASKRIARGIAYGAYVNETDAWRRNRAEATVVMQSDDSREGPRAFAEKRSPIWKGK